MSEHDISSPVFENYLEQEEQTKGDASAVGQQNDEEDEDELPDGQPDELQREQHSDYKALSDHEDNDETHGNDDYEQSKDDEGEAREEHFDDEVDKGAEDTVTRDFMSAPANGTNDIAMAEKDQSSAVDQQTRDTPSTAEDASESMDLSKGKDKPHGEDQLSGKTGSQDGQKPNPLALLTWDDLQAAFHAELEQKKAEEASTMQQFETLVAMYHEWANVATVHDEERAAKRLRTRIAFVQNHEQGLERKEERREIPYVPTWWLSELTVPPVNEVRAAFQKALSMLSGA